MAADTEYEVVAPGGVWDFGVWRLGRHRRTDAVARLQSVDPTLRGRAGDAQLFWNDARRLASWRHPHLAKISAVDPAADLVVVEWTPPAKRPSSVPDPSGSTMETVDPKAGRNEPAEPMAPDDPNALWQCLADGLAALEFVHRHGRTHGAVRGDVLRRSDAGRWQLLPPLIRGLAPREPDSVVDPLLSAAAPESV
ncbi:MAG: hypothetical protein ACRDD1_18780, partial [Planctomycetia bacterium]